MTVILFAGGGMQPGNANGPESENGESIPAVAQSPFYLGGGGFLPL